MNITREQAKALGRRAEQPKAAPGELFAIWCPGKLVNPLNGTPWVWQKRSRYAKAWKERVSLALLESLAPVGPRLRFAGTGPKRVTFTASTHNAMDSDGLQASLKPIRDALVECGVLSGGADRDGHVFAYHQKIDRARRGVEIRVALRARSADGATPC